MAVEGQLDLVVGLVDLVDLMEGLVDLMEGFVDLDLNLDLVDLVGLVDLGIGYFHLFSVNLRLRDQKLLILEFCFYLSYLYLH